MRTFGRWGVIALLVFIMAACNIYSGTPYENSDTCMADVQCSQELTRYMVCKEVYETGCDRYAFEGDR